MHVLVNARSIECTGNICCHNGQRTALNPTTVSCIVRYNKTTRFDVSVAVVSLRLASIPSSNPRVFSNILCDIAIKDEATFKILTAVTMNISVIWYVHDAV
jgi:hypothetical protein